jgi:hypothetical protein
MSLILIGIIFLFLPLNSYAMDVHDEAVWHKAVSLVKAGHILDGLRMMDSLNTEGNITDPQFMLDYAKLTESCLLPKSVVSSDTKFFLVPSARQSFNPLFKDEELLPQDVSWGTYSDKLYKKGTLFFAFEGDFLLDQEFQLKCSSLNNTKPFRFAINIDKQYQNKVFDPLIFDVAAKPYRAEVKIIIDLNKPKTPLTEYIHTLVYDRFDAVKETNDFPKLHGISLRCYNKSIFRNVPGDYYAFIAFDRNIKGNIQGRTNDTKIPQNEYQTARYLICMKTKQSVENKAESILRGIVKQFVQ